MSYYDNLQAKKVKLENKKASLTERKSEFSEENFARRLKQVEDELRDLEKKTSMHLDSLLRYMKKHNPEAYEQALENAVEKAVPENIQLTTEDGEPVELDNIAPVEGEESFE